MRLTIIPSDNMVIIDGRGQEFDLSGYASLDGLHAVQWKDAIGHVEFDNSSATQTTYKGNEEITGIEPYQDIIAAWTYFTEQEDAAMAEAGITRRAPPPLRKPPEVKR